MKSEIKGARGGVGLKCIKLNTKFSGVSGVQKSKLLSVLKHILVLEFFNFA